MSRVQCLLFDNDGTLVDSEWLCNRAIAIMFRTLTVRLDTHYLVTHYRGGELTRIFAELAKQHRVTLPDNFISQYRSLVAKLFRRRLRPVSGVIEALEQLPQPKAVVSNGPLSKMRQALTICKLRHYFGERLYSAYDLGHFKPDPQIYLASAEAMGFNAPRCAVIEDSLAGVEAGVRAGMQVFYYNPRQEHCPFAQAIVFADMEELPSLIAGLE